MRNRIEYKKGVILKTISMTTKLITLFLLILLAFSECKHPVKELRSENSDFKDSILNHLVSLSRIAPDTALIQSKRILTIDSLCSDSAFFYSISQNIGHSFFNLGSYDSCVFYINKSLLYWKKDTTKNGKVNYAKSLYNIAYIYYNMGQPDKAVQYYDSTLQFTNSEKFVKINILASLNKIKMLMDRDSYGEAIELVDNSLKKCTEYKDSSLMISTLQSYADVYTNCSFFEEAEKMYEDVLAYKKYFTLESEYTHYNNKGRMYYLEDDLSNAKQEFLIADSLAKNLSQYHTFITEMNLAEIYLNENQPDSAKHYLDKLQDNEQSLKGFPIFEFNYSSLLGEYYCKSSNHKKAGYYFAHADSISGKNSIDNVVLKLHLKRKANFHKNSGDLAKAYDAIISYNKINQSILEQNNRRRVAALQYKYQRDTTLMAQESKLVLKEQQIRSYKSRQLYFSLLIFTLFLSLLLVFLYYRKKKQLDHEKNIRKIGALKMESLRGRLSPHFLFNVLNNIWASMDDRESARNQFDNLTRLIRQSLINTEELAIALNEEIGFVKSFIELQKVGFNNDLMVEWNIGNNIDPDQPVPGMILQIPVENAIKHGLAPKKGTRLLQIGITQDSDYLFMVVKDNGIGLQHSVPSTKGTGTGLKVLTNTIHILNQANEKKMSYEIMDCTKEEGAGTKVTIKIPVKFNYDLS